MNKSYMEFLVTIDILYWDFHVAQLQFSKKIIRPTFLNFLNEVKILKLMAIQEKYWKYLS